MPDLIGQWVPEEFFCGVLLALLLTPEPTMNIVRINVKRIAGICLKPPLPSAKIWMTGLGEKFSQIC